MLNWYANTTRMLRDVFGNDVNLVTGLLAACSPQVQLKTSWDWAMQIYKQFRQGKHPDLRMLMRCHRLNVKRVLAGEPLQGRKVQNFYQALLGDNDAVVLDMWMLRLCKYYPRHNHNPQGGRYDRLAKCFASVARYNGYNPAEFQALLWCNYRAKAGYEPVSYLQCIENPAQLELFERIPI